MSVNYLIEINGLDDWELTHPIPATAYKLMRKLQYLANKERFPVRISVPNGLLISMIGCSEDSLLRARNCLIQNGLISYKGQKKLTPIYEIHYFSLRGDDNPKFAGINQGINQGINHGINQGVNWGINQGPYINKTKEGEEAVQPRQERGSADALPKRGMPLSLADERLLIGLRIWLDRASNGLFDKQAMQLERLRTPGRFPVPLLCEAIERTERRHSRGALDNPMAYALALLYDWEEKDIRNLEALEASRGGMYAGECAEG